jgi:hypothetical protein
VVSKGGRGLCSGLFFLFLNRKSHSRSVIGIHDVGIHDVGIHDVGIHDVGIHDVAWVKVVLFDMCDPIACGFLCSLLPLS